MGSSPYQSPLLCAAQQSATRQQPVRPPDGGAERRTPVLPPLNRLDHLHIWCCSGQRASGLSRGHNGDPRCVLMQRLGPFARQCSLVGAAFATETRTAPRRLSCNAMSTNLQA